MLSDRHRARLAEGAQLAQTPRLPWSVLLRRTYAADVLACPRCHGRARVIAAIQDPTEAARFLEAIDQVSEPRRSHLLLGADDDSQLPPPSSRRPNLPVPDD